MLAASNGSCQLSPAQLLADMPRSLQLLDSGSKPHPSPGAPQNRQFLAAANGCITATTAAVTNPLPLTCLAGLV